MVATFLLMFAHGLPPRGKALPSRRGTLRRLPIRADPEQGGAVPFFVYVAQDQPSFLRRSRARQSRRWALGSQTSSSGGAASVERFQGFPTSLRGIERDQGPVQHDARLFRAARTQHWRGSVLGQEEQWRTPDTAAKSDQVKLLGVQSELLCVHSDGWVGHEKG